MNLVLMASEGLLGDQSPPPAESDTPLKASLELYYPTGCITVDSVKIKADVNGTPLELLEAGGKATAIGGYEYCRAPKWSGNLPLAAGSGTVTVTDGSETLVLAGSGLLAARGASLVAPDAGVLISGQPATLAIGPGNDRVATDILQVDAGDAVVVFVQDGQPDGGPVFGVSNGGTTNDLILAGNEVTWLVPWNLPPMKGQIHFLGSVLPRVDTCSGAVACSAGMEVNLYTSAQLLP